MRFGREDLNDNLIREMRPLWDSHHKEISQMGQALDPDLSVYKQAQTGGMLRIYTARIADLLVGYNVFFVRSHPHFRGSVEAIQDLLYLDPDVRQGLVGYKFIKFCDEQLKKENVQMIYRHISADHDHGAMLKRIGYRLVDLVYGRKL